MDETEISKDCQQCKAELLSEAETLRRLNDASSRLWRTTCLRAGLEEMLIATIELLGATLGNVQFVDESTGKLIIATQQGFGPEFLEYFREVSIDDGSACGRALRSGERVIIEDVELDPCFATFVSIARKAGFRAVQSTPILSRDGKPLGMISTHFAAPHRPSEVNLARLDLYVRQASDFIERCRREEELRQRAEEREALLDALPAFIWFGDAQSHVIQGNRAASEMTGVPAGGNVSQSVIATGQATYLRQLKQDGTEYPPEELPIQTAIANRRPLHDVYVDFRFPDGRRVETIGNAAPLFDANGAVRGGVAALIDITDRNLAERALRESEEFNRTIIDCSPDCVKVLDLEGRLLMINEAGRRLLEIDDPASLYGRDWRRIWTRSATDEVGDVLAQAKAGRTLHFEERHATFKGAEKWWDVIMTPVCGSDGSVVRILSVSRDITERKRAEDALREADRRKDEFLATLAHELRNPLAAIANAVSVMKKSRDGDGSVAGQTPKLLSMTENQVGHLVRLVDDLLEVSRITSGKIDLKKRPVDLAVVIRQAIETNRTMIEASRHETILSLPDCPLMVDGDPVRLAQIFANLFSNAVKYTPAEGRIGVSMERSHDICLVRIKDTGAGIPKDMLSRIFELFIQVDRTVGRSQGGLGLGLTLARRLVELHGGDIEARSEGVGRGSEFIVRLPLSADLPQRDISIDVPIVKTFPSRRVLIVDDDATVADSLAMLLEAMGVVVRTAYSGIEALQAVPELKPHLAFIDIGMPGMDGYETARCIRKLADGKNVILAALSGWGRSEDRKRGLEAGFDRHYVKPIDVSDIEEVLTLGDRG
ncbi:MAG: ATP-binding protein [Methylocystis sp.]|uniref:ATP-binding protein n=1 Tax=Methylocystis sp. TaxID=1911079 RepID=UPI003DA2702D